MEKRIEVFLDGVFATISCTCTWKSKSHHNSKRLCEALDKYLNEEQSKALRIKMDEEMEYSVVCITHDRMKEIVMSIL